MKLDDSPSLEDYTDGIPPESTGKSEGKGPIAIILWSLVILIVILLGVNFAQGNAIGQFIGAGTLSGQAINESGQPIKVDVLVFGTKVIEQSDKTGFFKISGIPSGQQSIIVAYGDIATEIIVMINAGQTTDMGVVEVPTSFEIDY
jgi:hypothetical protein